MQFGSARLLFSAQSRTPDAAEAQTQNGTSNVSDQLVSVKLSIMQFANRSRTGNFRLLPRVFANCRFLIRHGIARRLFRTSVMAAVWLPLVVAQTGQSPDQQPASSSAVTHHVGLVDKVFGWVAPGQPTRLTEKDRFQLYLLYTGGPIPLIGEAMVAGIGQWSNHPPEWGQGWNAFGKRYGSNLAYNAVRQTITYGTSAAFREDNRYFASNKQGFWPRTKYALVSTFTARHPDGRLAFSVSAVTGVAGAATISSIWGPPSWKGAGNIAEIAGISFATTAGFNIVREFLLDIFHRPQNTAGRP